MAQRSRKTGKKRVTRYTFDDVADPVTPETGHTALIGEEQVVELRMDNGWSEAIRVGGPVDKGSRLLIDLDPTVEPVLFWAGKRNHREVAVLPLQRNEVVTESRIARIVSKALEKVSAPGIVQGVLFADLEKGLREEGKDKRIEFYTHDEGWMNKLICGDSLEVMESLTYYEGLRGSVQMIYVDPPYGIKYDSNFQQRLDSTKNSPKEKGDDVLTIRAFRDTWTLGIHSYLTYLADRLYLSRDLLADSGSIFVQISDANVHLVRALLDEVFGRRNFMSQITFQKTGSQEASFLGTTVDYLLWYAKNKDSVVYRQLYRPRLPGDLSLDRYDQLELPDGSARPVTQEERNTGVIPAGGRRFQLTSLISSGETSSNQDFEFDGETYQPRAGNHWKTTVDGLQNLAQHGRIVRAGKTLRYKRYADDFSYVPLDDRWESMQLGRELDFVVQTAPSVVERCLLLSTRPGDLVLDPTCGSGTTAIAAEKLGRRWITCDTSRVAVNVARRRLLSSAFEHYVTREGGLAQDFVYDTARRTSLRTVAYDLESETVDLFDQPLSDRGAIRVTGPFEVLTLGRYSAQDWTGFVQKGEGATATLENYVAVIAHLYRSDASLRDAVGVVQASAETLDRKIGISVGPITGRVTGRQIYDAAGEAALSGLKEVHVLGWAFEANVGEVKAKVEAETSVTVELVMIRPDTLAEGLKTGKPESLFSPLALPDVLLMEADGGEWLVELQGVAVFDRKEQTTTYKRAESGYVAAWYVDEDYDGDCFVDCQMFFDFKRRPAIERTLGIQIDPEEWTLRLTSDPFAAGKYRTIAVRVVDVYGNESTVVRQIS